MYSDEDGKQSEKQKESPCVNAVLLGIIALVAVSSVACSISFIILQWKQFDFVKGIKGEFEWRPLL